MNSDAQFGMHARCMAASLVLAGTFLSGSSAARDIEIVGPAGSNRFGASVTTLANGNIVVLDPKFAPENIGAVYLYSPVGVLISRLTGSAPDDLQSASVISLANGNFVVASPFWNRDTVDDAGAVTWVDGRTGLNGSISEQNSLVGTYDSDRVGVVVPLRNGNYLVKSDLLDQTINGTRVANVGAWSWAPGNARRAGAIDALNSFLGTSTADMRDSQAVELDNGHVAIGIPLWNNGAFADAGATLWINGYAGGAGVVSSGNSLVGSSENSLTGMFVTALTGGYYLVGSPGFSDGISVVGAITRRDGRAPDPGTVRLDNSLVGASDDDQVGRTVALPSGDALAITPRWSDTTTGDATVGAITFISDAAAPSGRVERLNSLVGGQADDVIGSGGVVVLANGNFVVSSPNWGDSVGAATWVHASGAGMAGQQVTQANSMTGSRRYDGANSEVIALANGNYVYNCPGCDRGDNIEDVGAVVLCDGLNGSTGIVSVTNALYGSSEDDRVGDRVIALSNGNYVIRAPAWNDPVNSVQDAGAVT